MKLEEIKQNVSEALERLRISPFVSLDEIEKELSRVDTSFQSLLLLGILSRIMYKKDEKSAQLFIPSIIQWKNYLPRQDLGGLSPIEFEKKYPRGKYEAYFIKELIEEYERHLEEKGKFQKEKMEEVDIREDFKRFQKDYLNRIPLKQPFVQESGRLMTIKEIIMEERKRSGFPKEAIDKIGIELFAENIAENLGRKIAFIEDRYFTALEEFKKMQEDPKARSLAKIRAIRKQFEENEPFHRCGIAPHQFYLNYAMVVFLDSTNPDLAISLLDKALSYKPDYKLALELKERIKKFFNNINE